MGGKVPFSALLPSCRFNKAGNAAPSPQDGGIPPMQAVVHHQSLHATMFMLNRIDS